MEENKKTFILPSIDMLPTSEEAVIAYEREDGHFSLPEVFAPISYLGTNSSRNCVLITLILRILVLMSFSIAL